MHNFNRLFKRQINQKEEIVLPPVEEVSLSRNASINTISQSKRLKRDFSSSSLAAPSFTNPEEFYKAGQCKLENLNGLDFEEEEFQQVPAVVHEKQFSSSGSDISGDGDRSDHSSARDADDERESDSDDTLDDSLNSGDLNEEPPPKLHYLFEKE